MAFVLNQHCEDDDYDDEWNGDDNVLRKAPCCWLQPAGTLGRKLLEAPGYGGLQLLELPDGFSLEPAAPPELLAVILVSICWR